MHHSCFYEWRWPGCRVVLALLVDYRQFSAACRNAPGYLPSNYSLLSLWHFKSSVHQTARGAFQSPATYQHKAEGKNPADTQLQDNWSVSSLIYNKFCEHPFLVGDVELTKQLIFNLSLDCLLHWLYILLEDWLVDDYSTCALQLFPYVAR